MGGAHAHGHGHGDARVEVRTRARVVLLLFLAVSGLGTVVGLVALWPHSTPATDPASTAFAAPGVTFPHARVVTVQKPCPPTKASQGDPGGGGSYQFSPHCGQVIASVRSGESAGTTVRVQVAPEISRSGLSRGDDVELVRTPPQQGAPASFTFFGVDRSTSLWALAAVFVLAVALVARVRGLLALVGLGFGALVLVKFMLPALLIGSSGLAVALVGSSAIMFVVLYLAHGVSMRTSTALAGTLLGILITAITAVVAVESGRMSGVSDETGQILSSFVGHVSFQGLLVCAVIIAGLGVLNDVTITQASAVWELRSAAPEMTRGQLFGSAMRIGRDHIASTIYTIIFAYAGAALSVLLLLFLYHRPVLELLSTEDISEEVVRALSSALGLVLAVPVTTAIATAVVVPPRLGQRRRLRATPGITQLESDAHL